MAGGVSIGPRIQVDGEEKYRQQIRNIIEQSKTLDAEMKALTATFSDEDTAQQKAAKSTDLLNLQLEAARERTRLVREMTQKAAETTKENSTQTLKWRQALASAEEQQAKLERAVEENNRALEDQGEAMEKSADLFQDYQDAIAGIDRTSKTLDAEMKALTARFGEEDTAQQKAEKSADLLNKQLETAIKRRNIAAKAVEMSSKATGENSEQTLKLREALANAEIAESRLQKAVEDNRKAMEDEGEETEDASQKMAGLGDSINVVTEKLGIQLPDAAKEALNGVNGFSAGTVASMAGAAAAIGAAYEVGKNLFNLTREAAAQADELLTRSARTGIDTSTLQGLDYASRFLDFEGLDKTLVKFTQSMAAANEGTKAQAEAFAQLGVSVIDMDGNLLNSYDTFLAAIDALGQIENATARDAIANDLFGKSYADMKPLIDAGTGALQSYLNEAERLGYVLDEDSIQKLGALDDAMQKNKASADALKNEIAVELAPAYTRIAEAATSGMDAFRIWLESGREMRELIDSYSETAEAVEEGGGRMAEAIAAATETATADIQTLRAAYDEAYEAAQKSLDGQFSLWEQAGEVTATSTSDMLAGLQSQIDYWDTYEDNFNDLISRNIEGIEEFASNFNDGSMASAAALAGLRNATDEEIRQIIAKMAETDQAKDNIARQFADLEVDVSGSLDLIKENYGKTVTSLNTETGKIDFSPLNEAVEKTFGDLELKANTAGEKYGETIQGIETTSANINFEPFEAKVDGTFSFLETRAQTAANHVTAYLAEMAKNMQAIEIIEQSTIVRDINAGYNAAGTDSWKGGLTWVGESGPELVRLPQGTQIYNNQKSREIAAAAGTDTRAMEQFMSEGVSLLRDIRREFSALQVKRRMA